MNNHRHPAVPEVPHIASLKKKVLTLLSRQPQASFAIKEIARKLAIRSSAEFLDLRSLVDQLRHEGLVTVDGKGLIAYVSAKKQTESHAHPPRLVGTLSVNRRGMGYVSVEGMEEDIVITPRFMHNALHGDTVAVVPFARPFRRSRGDRSRTEGEVVEVIRRGFTTIAGRLEKRGHFFVVIPDNPQIVRDIYVTRSEAARAHLGDKVVLELLPWEDEHLNPEGRIIEVLGPAGDARVEVISVARRLGLPTEFPADVLHEVEKFGSTLSSREAKGRLDYRKKLCFTIDPEDAKDFDDAISYERMQNGHVRLGVHIADVSYYVREGSALDVEALRRGTSVYLVNGVIPMLPERLSNDLCSLKPEVDRLTYSVLMDVNEHGTVESYQLTKTLIRSARRFTYEEVQGIIEQRKGEMAEVVLPLLELTRVLYKKRKKNGSLDFETAEAKFRFDEHGLPVEIVKKRRLEAHRLVEECMLLANKIVARHIGFARRDEFATPFVYRVHDLPHPERLHDLANFVKQFGYSMNAQSGVSSRDLQKLLDDVKGSEVEYLINDVALRSMAKAVYSEKNIGHYGLAFKYYTHFTSPIRRYPDLIVHRLLHEYQQGMETKRREALALGLPSICRQSSDRERISLEAERASVKVMQVEYLKRHVGDIMEGVIGGVTEFGLFVEITDLLIEGLVRVRDLGDDYYLFDEKHYALRGRSRGRTYRLGDRVKVQVVAVNPDNQEIDLAIVQ